jgi:hypothetical protein
MLKLLVSYARFVVRNIALFILGAFVLLMIMWTDSVRADHDLSHEYENDTLQSQCLQRAQIMARGGLMRYSNETVTFVVYRWAEQGHFFKSDRDRIFYMHHAEIGYAYIDKMWNKALIGRPNLDEHAKPFPPGLLKRWAQTIRMKCLTVSKEEVNFRKVQNEKLDEPVDYEGMERRVTGCQNNLPLYFDRCFKDGVTFSEAQIGARVTQCNVFAWKEFFDCVKLYPKGWTGV